LKTLERNIGLWGVVAISVSAMIGSGIFVLPGIAALKTGPSIWLAYLLAGLCVIPPALAKAELATAMPVSGGSYVYLERTFGPFAGTIAGFGLWISLLLKSSFALVGFKAYLVVMWPAVETVWIGNVVACLLLAGIVGLNIAGVKAISKIQKVIIVVVLSALVFVGAKSGPTYRPELLDDFFTHGWSGFLSAMAFVYLSFAGVTKVAAIAEEVENPGRNLPMGIAISLGLVTVAYSLAALLLVTHIPISGADEAGRQLGTDLRPIYTVSKLIGGSALGYIMAIFSVVTMISMAIAGLLASSRFPFAMARDQLLPPQLCHLNERFRTPVNAIVLTGLGMGFAIVFLPVQQIAKLTSAFMIIIYMSENFTVLVLRESNTNWYKPLYKAPFYPFIHILGLMLGFMLLVMLGLTGLFASLAVVVIGSIFYLSYGRKKTNRKGVVEKRGRRTDLVSQVMTRPVLSDALHDAPVLVPLLEHERSPEILVEMGAALARGKRINVVQVVEVPEQSGMSAFYDENVKTKALERRLLAMAEEEGIDLDFETSVTRDLEQAIYKAATISHCDWVVIEWAGWSGQGITINNPIGWLQDHLPCKMAVFKDAGVRYIRQIMVLVEPGPHDSLVVTTADHLASLYKAELNFVAVVADGASEDEADYVHQMRSLSIAPGRVVILHSNDEVKCLEEASAGYDLLVMGAPAERSFLGFLLGTPKDRLTKHAACSVLWIKTPRGAHHQSFDPSKSSIIEAQQKLLNYSDRALIQCGNKIKNKDRLFKDIAEAFDEVVEGPHFSDLLSAFWKREQIQNTSVGMGLAVPHATFKGLERTTIGLFTLASPLDYGAPDGQAVDIVFVLLGPPGDRHTHLDLLRRISMLFCNKDFVESLRSAKDNDGLHEVLDGLNMFDQLPR
jgi:basic amino acid/polyamine antiporter, APA family